MFDGDFNSLCPQFFQQRWTLRQGWRRADQKRHDRYFGCYNWLAGRPLGFKLVLHAPRTGSGCWGQYMGHRRGITPGFQSNIMFTFAIVSPVLIDGHLRLYNRTIYIFWHVAIFCPSISSPKAVECQVWRWAKLSCLDRTRNTFASRQTWPSPRRASSSCPTVIATKGSWSSTQMAACWTSTRARSTSCTVWRWWRKKTLSAWPIVNIPA